ncbi:hypothetical protein BDR26DRAFT_968308 [Obelidium mucronatum]|nr:hypothetical protein BDR26DRAFT_968308 [Obelidium mucronatum]
MLSSSEINLYKFGIILKSCESKNNGTKAWSNAKRAATYRIKRDQAKSQSESDAADDERGSVLFLSKSNKTNENSAANPAAEPRKGDSTTDEGDISESDQISTDKENVKHDNRFKAPLPMKRLPQSSPETSNIIKIQRPNQLSDANQSMNATSTSETESRSDGSITESVSAKSRRAAAMNAVIQTSKNVWSSSGALFRKSRGTNGIKSRSSSLSNDRTNDSAIRENTDDDLDYEDILFNGTESKQRIHVKKATRYHGHNVPSVEIHGQSLLQPVSIDGGKQIYYLCRPISEILNVQIQEGGNCIQVDLDGISELVATKSQFKRLLLFRSRKFVQLLFNLNSGNCQMLADFLRYLNSHSWILSKSEEPVVVNPAVEPSKQFKDLQKRNKMLTEKESKATKELRNFRELLPIQLKKQFKKIKLLDAKSPKSESRYTIISSLLDALAKGNYHPDLFNYKFCNSQFKYAVLDNIRGSAAQNAVPSEVLLMWLQFVADCGKTPYEYLRGNGFKQESDNLKPEITDPTETDDNSDTGAEIEPKIKFRKSTVPENQKSRVGDHSGALFLPHIRTIQKKIQELKASNKTFGLSKSRVDEIAKLCKLDRQKMEDLGGVLAHGHQTDESDMGLDDVTVSTLLGKTVIFGLPDYGGLEEREECPFKLLPGIAKSKNELERILNSYQERVVAVSKTMAEGKDIFTTNEIVNEIKNLFGDILNDIQKLQAFIQSTLQDVKKSLLSAEKRLKKKAKEGNEFKELHGNAIAAKERKESRLISLSKFNDNFNALKQDVDSTLSSIDIDYCFLNSDFLQKLLYSCLSLFQSTSLAVAPRGTKLEIHLISDSFHLGSHIIFSFISASVTAELSCYFGNLVYEEMAQRGIHLLWKAADGLTIAHSMYNGRQRPTTATAVFKQSVEQFEQEISRNELKNSSAAATRELKRERKTQFFQSSYMEAIMTLSDQKLSGNCCWFQIPPLPPSCNEILTTKKKPTAGNFTQLEFVEATREYQLELKRNQLIGTSLKIKTATNLCSGSREVYLSVCQNNGSIHEVQLLSKGGKQLWAELYHQTMQVCIAAECAILLDSELDEWCYFINFVLQLAKLRDTENLDFFQHMYIPEVRNGVPYVSIYDWPHLNKCFTTSVSENGFTGFITKDEVEKLLNSNLTLLTNRFKDRDKQKVFDAKYFWSLPVQTALESLGLTDAANFWQVVRECDEAFDNDGLLDSERIERQQTFLMVLKSKLMPSLYMNPQSTHCPNLRISEREIKPNRLLEGALPWDQAVKAISSLEGIMIIKTHLKLIREQLPWRKRYTNVMKDISMDSRLYFATRRVAKYDAQLKQNQAIIGALKSDESAKIETNNLESINSHSKVIALVNDSAFGSNDCESQFSVYKRKQGHTAMGRVNSTSSEQATHAAHMLSLLDRQSLRTRLRGRTSLGYTPFSRRPTTFRSHRLFKNVYKWGTPDSSLKPNTAIPITKKISTFERKERQQNKSAQTFDAEKGSVRGYHRGVAGA